MIKSKVNCHDPIMDSLLDGLLSKLNVPKNPNGSCLNLENEKSMDHNLRFGWNDYFILKLVLNNGFEIFKYPEMFSQL